MIQLFGYVADLVMLAGHCAEISWYIKYLNITKNGLMFTFYAPPNRDISYF